MKRRLITVLIPAVAALAFAAPAVAATSGTSSEAVSENWAGYEATTTNASGFSAASGSWVQPSVSASTGQSYSAYWVGLGGGGESSTALEQEGTQADVSSSGKVSYYAWYELVPSAPVKIKSVAVHAGDKIWARTAVSGDRVTVTVDNKTTGQDFTKTLIMTKATPDTSTAEWVAEAPSECAGGSTGECEPLPLSDFGSVRFTNAYATAGGATKSVSGWNDQAIALSPAVDSDYGYGAGYGGGFGGAETVGAASNSEGAAPGTLSTDGTAFTVTYGAEATGYGDLGSGYGAFGYGGGYSLYGYASGYGYAGGYGNSGDYTIQSYGSDPYDAVGSAYGYSSEAYYSAEAEGELYGY
jgi:hypothetical protein